MKLSHEGPQLVATSRIVIANSPCWAKIHAVSNLQSDLVGLASVYSTCKLFVLGDRRMLLDTNVYWLAGTDSGWFFPATQDTQNHKYHTLLLVELFLFRISLVYIRVRVQTLCIQFSTLISSVPHLQFALGSGDAECIHSIPMPLTLDLAVGTADSKARKGETQSSEGGDREGNKDLGGSEDHHLRPNLIE